MTSLESNVMKRHNKIAIVQMWPELKTAEDEVMARIKNACKILDVEVVTIDTAGKAINYPHKEISSDDVDFVIHLHFETPKTYDAFSFVALWNPLDFYFEWGYKRHSQNLMTHDDFLSCGSQSADDHVRRMIETSNSHLEPDNFLYHSLPEPFYEPSLGEKKLFYVGINWEKIGKGTGRHDDLLKSLDGTGDLVIYGPKIFQGVDVWEGYNSYVGPIPFDGFSIIGAIHNAGIALVLSSDAHKKSGLMSSRLFEGLAAGALIIVDENPFAYEHFGDTLLYIKTQNVDAEDITKQVRKHIEWAKENPEEAVNLASKAQEIFKQKFDMCSAIHDIYANFDNRKQLLNENLLSKEEQFNLTIFGILLKYDELLVKKLLKSYNKQNYKLKQFVIIIDDLEYELFSENIHALIGNNDNIVINRVNFYQRNMKDQIVGEHNIGKVLYGAIDGLPDNFLFSFLFPCEKVFSEHYSTLVRAFEDNVDLDVAYTDLIITHNSNNKTHFDLVNTICPFNNTHNHPNGFSRFLFKKDSSSWISSTLPYLGWGFVDALYVKSKNSQEISRASSIIDITALPYSDMEAFKEDFELIADSMMPSELVQFMLQRNQLMDMLDLGKNHVTTPLGPLNVKLNRLSIEERREIIAHLLESLTLPKWIMFIIRKLFALFNRNK
jgi:hypothetical protein